MSTRLAFMNMACAGNVVALSSSIGARVGHGKIMMGVSPVTHRPLFAAAADAAYLMTLEEANDGAALYKGRLPDMQEVELLINLQRANGGFVCDTSDPQGWYWLGNKFPSSSDSMAWRAENNIVGPFAKWHMARVRLVFDRHDAI